MPPRYETRRREYTRMTSSGVKPMTKPEIVEEAIDTIKIGKRKGLAGKEKLDLFLNGGTKDNSICREGLIDLQNGLEMLLKGIIQYYGESYIEEHFTANNAPILESLFRLFPETVKLKDAIPILEHDDFSFMMFKCSKYPRYSSFKTKQDFIKQAYKVLFIFIGYVDKYIVPED